MRQFILFVMVAAVMAACSFDSSGLSNSANNTSNNNNTNNVNPCENVDCNDGTCVVVDATGFTCECTGNWAGDHCEECKPGYTGTDCEECADGAILLDDGSCIENPCEGIYACSNHGECSVDLSTGDYSCVCETGYSGNDCEACGEFYIEYPADSGTCVLDPCNGVSCGDGACVVTGSESFACDCDEGYAGEFCGSCDTANGYIDHDGLCELSPCQGFDCGLGSCTVDATDFTASCNCPSGYDGEHCEINLNNILVYQNFWGQLLVQIRGDWGNFTGDLRITYVGSSSNSHLVFYNQTDDLPPVNSEGFLLMDPCLAGVDETVKMVIAEPPYDANSTLIVENAVSPDPKDPDGFIYTDGNGTVIRAECSCFLGVCGISPAGNDP